MNRDLILGQRLAFAAAALLAGVASYISLLGFEKGLLAVVFGALALRREPGPALDRRRGWAWAGIVLGAGMMLLVPALLLLYRDRLGELIEALEKLQ